jgi:ribosomal protein L13
MVKLDTVNGPGHQSAHVVAVAETNGKGDYRNLSHFATGNYVIVMRNQKGTITGSRTVSLRGGHTYDISAHLVQHPGNFFFLPIFSY